MAGGGAHIWQNATDAGEGIEGRDTPGWNRPGRPGVHWGQVQQENVPMRNVILWLLGVPVTALVLLNVFGVI